MIPYLRTFFHPLFVYKEAFQHRLHSLQRLLQKKRLRAHLITNLSNIRYLTGLQISAGAILVERTQATLFLDGRYYNEGKELSWMNVGDAKDFPRILKTVRTVGFEEKSITVHRLSRWKAQFKNTKFVQTKDFVEGLRQQKDSAELQSIKTACSMTKKILRTIPSFLVIGKTEREISWSIESLARKLGAESMAFETIVGFGENSSRPHHHPTHRKLRKSDIVQIDLGLKVNGYCSDMSRVFFLAPKTSAQRKAYSALLKAKKTAEKLVKKGVDVRALDLAARAVLKQYGYTHEFSHSLGHGLGLDIHEAPAVSAKAQKHLLKKGEVITVEPGLYFPGEWGMRVEDTIVVE